MSSSFCEGRAASSCNAQLSFCNPDTPGVCAETTEGQRACVDLYSGSCESNGCAATADCADGHVCVKDSCCGSVCMKAGKDVGDRDIARRGAREPRGGATIFGNFSADLRRAGRRLAH